MDAAEFDALGNFDDAVAGGASLTDALRASIAQHPACAALLADHAATVAGVETVATADAAPVEELISERADRLFGARQSAASTTALPERQAATSTSALSGIIAKATELGLRLPALCERVGLPRSVVVKLDRRLIDAATVPSQVVARVAEQLAVSADVLRSYLQTAPTLSGAASYRAKEPPALADAESGDVAPREAWASAIGAALQSGEISEAQRPRLIEGG
jgi:hypothetical protein